MAENYKSTSAKEFSKFIESPTRSGESCVEVSIASSAFLSAGTAIQSRVSVSNTNGLLIAANSSRKFLIISNNNNTDFFIGYGVAAVVDQGILIPANDKFIINASNLYTGAIYAIKATSVSITIDLIEGT